MLHLNKSLYSVATLSRRAILLTALVAGSFAFASAAAAAGSQQLTVVKIKAGAGNGTVTSSPVGISCGATCSAPFNVGTKVTLTAAPAAGSSFAGFTGGGCAGTATTCTVTIGVAATAVAATFTATAPPLGIHRVTVFRIGLRAHKHQISHGRTRISFKGKIYLGSAFNPAFCYGKVDITVKHGSKTVATKLLSVGYRRCTFGQSVTVRTSQLHNDGGRVYARFTGNKFVFPAASFGAKF